MIYYFNNAACEDKRFAERLKQVYPDMELVRTIDGNLIEFKDNRVIDIKYGVPLYLDEFPKQCGILLASGLYHYSAMRAQIMFAEEIAARAGYSYLLLSDITNYSDIYLKMGYISTWKGYNNRSGNSISMLIKQLPKWNIPSKIPGEDEDEE